MKVLHVLYQSLPNTAGSSIRSRDIIVSQLRAGIRPIVITSPFQEPLNSESIKEEIEGIVYYRTTSNSKKEIVKEELTGFFTQLKKLVRIISFSYLVYKIAKKENVDVIHAHAMFFCAFAAKISSLFLGIPMIYEVRSLWEERYKNKGLFTKFIFEIVTLVESIAMYCSDYIIVINKNLEENIKARYLLKNKKIDIVSNAVDLENIKIINAPTRKTVFSYIGTLSPIEGLNLLIKAFNNLYSNGFQNKLLIYGDGIEKERLKLLAKNNPLIEFKGRFQQKEISIVYSTIDIVINPRISNFLTNSVTPLKPLEAMAYKKLVLASDVGGMKELIEDHQTGFLFKSDSVEEIEKIIVRVLERKDFNTIIEKAYQYILKNKSWDKNTEIYHKIYTDLING